MTRFTILMSLVVASVTTIVARAQEIAYTVRLADVRSQIVEVEMLVKGWEQDSLEAHLPAWRPGKYTILDPAGTVREVWASKAEGQRLEVRQTAKASWRIDNARGDVRVTYRLYANSLGDRTRHADDTHAFLSGSTVFIVAENAQDASGLLLKVRGALKIRSMRISRSPGVLSVAFAIGSCSVVVVIVSPLCARGIPRAC